MTRRISSPVFIGRRAELERLEEALDRTARGEPGVVLVAGEAGVGKSRLVAEFTAVVEAAGGRALSGACIDVGGGVAYAPVAEALRAYVRRLQVEDRPTAFGPWTVALSGLVPDLRGPAAGADAGNEAAFGPGRQAMVFDAVIGGLGHLASPGPVALILEDLHWADGSTRDLVRFLVRNLDTDPVVIVATYRSDDLHRRHPLLPLLSELERSERVERLELARFDRAELAAQLEGILGQRPAESVVDALLARSSGIPFYVEELVAAGDDGSDLPASLREILGQRLAVLSDRSFRVVQVASVIGGLVPHAPLAEVTGLDDAALVAAIGEAVDARILVAPEAGGEPSYEFRHALLREAAADTLLPVERVKLHLQIADHLDARLAGQPAPDASVAADAAFHAYAAHDLPRALRTSVLAVRASVAATTYREALGHAERALELWDRVDKAEELAGTDRAGLLALASQVAAASNRPEQAVTLGRAAVAELEPTGDVARLAGVLADQYMFEWEAQEFAASAAAVRRAFDLVRDLDPSRLKATVYWMTGWERWWDGRLTDAVELLESSMAIAESIGDRALWADAAGAQAHALADLGHAVRGAAIADRSAASIEFDGRPMSLWVVPDRVFAWLTAGRFEDAARAASAGLELARRYGWEARLGGDLVTCATDALIELGRYAEVESMLDAYQPIMGGWTTRTWVRQARGQIATIQGRLDDAHRLIDDLEPVGSAGAAEFWDAVCRAELACAEGAFDRLQAAVEAGLLGRARGESVGGLWHLLGIAIGGGADHAVGCRRRRRPREAAEAGDLADRWLEMLRTIVAQGRAAGGAGPFIEATLAAAEAEARRARGDADPTAWGEVVGRWMALSHPRHAALAGLRLSEAIMERSRDRAAAGKALREAHATSAAIGADLLGRDIDRLADRMGLELRHGDEPKGAAVDAPVAALPSLTDRERDVLRLVAEGHTNREIGTGLFISEKTVSVHVSNAMAKLGALSRYEAAASAERLGLLRARSDAHARSGLERW